VTDEPTSDEAKELYAYFGLAFYCSSVLEHGVANALMALELLEGRGGARTQAEWETLVDRHYESSFAKTLGTLIRQLPRHHQRLPELAAMAADFEQSLKERNFLAHHFWREHAEHWFTSEGRTTMVQRLEEARDLFATTDRKLDAAVQPFEARHGITREAVSREMEQILRDGKERHTKIERAV
jgi:hypothetical protein